MSLEAAPLPNRSRRKLAFGWYGGKYSHLEWLLPLLLPDCHHYCEPFAGSAAVLLNRPPSPVETYNDLDGEVVTFFRVLRDHSEKLTRAIALTPFSREEFFVACQPAPPDIDDVERARRFYVRARQVRTGLAQTASLGRWANCKNTSRAGMSGVVSRWLGGVEALPDIAQRLLRVQIENRPALEVIDLYDEKGTLFYCDPPYVHDARGDSKAYGYEMTDNEHRAFANRLHGIKGKAAVSGYRCDLYDDIFKNWRCIVAPMKHCHSIKKPRQEVLWVNY
jgi:DNA adenine methylase